MQDFFNLGDEEENAKLIWCIGKKKKKKISDFDKTNWYWDFSNKSLRFNSVGAEPFPSPDCCRAQGCYGWRDGAVRPHRLGSLARPHAPSGISLITALEAA